MTTIIGYQGDGFAVIGADTRISSFDDSGSAYQITTLGSGSTKIASNGKYLLGAAGDMRAINILHHVFQPPAITPGLKGKKLDEFITVKFIPALRSCFDSHGYSPPAGKDNEHLAEQGSSIVVVVNSTIYVVETDYSWTSDIFGVYATGSGSAYALGAMQALCIGKKALTPQQAKAAINKALQIASKFDPYTGSPFNFYTQEHLKKAVAL